MAEVVGESPLKISTVPIGQVFPNDYNPNVMDSEKFDMLTEDVEVEDMDQPVVVRWDEPSETYIIVDGEHRWRAAKMAGKEDILISLKNWDAKESKLRTVRRNLLRGSLDPTKFSTLVRQVEAEQDMNINDVRKRMGFSSEKEFARVYTDDTAITDKAIEKIKADVEDATKDMTMVSELVRAILIKYGTAVQSGTICFVHNKSVVLGVAVSPDQAEKLQSVADLIKDLGMGKQQLAPLIDTVVASMLVALEDELG